MFLGERTSLRAAIEEMVPLDPGEYQVIDTVPNGNDTQSGRASVNTGLPTVIVSTRRFDLGDAAGEVEQKLRTACPRSIILRCAPMASTMHHFRFSADHFGVVASAFHDEGVAWLTVADLIEVIAAVLADLDRGVGRAFDLTGPSQISMRTLADFYGHQMGKVVDVRRLPPAELIAVLRSTGMDARFATWLAYNQQATSDPRLDPVTPNVESILGRAPLDALQTEN